MLGTSGGNGDSRAYRDPAAIAEAVERAQRSSDELGRLLSETLGWLQMARRSLSAFRLRAGSVVHMDVSLSAADVALDRMNDLVHAAMQGPSLGIGSPLLSDCPPVTLRDAVRHAADDCVARAESQGTDVVVRTTLQCGAIASGAMYAVVLGVLRWTLDSIGKAGGECVVEVLSWVEPGPAGDVLCVEIRDDGPGLKLRPTCAQSDSLAIAMHVAREHAGTLELEEAGSGPEQRGVCVRVRCPAQTQGGSRRVGRIEH